MLSVNVSQVLVNHRYRSNNRRPLEGQIVRAELYNKWDNTYRIEFKDYATSRYYWATIQVIPDED